jgi:hypothetical protein
MMFLKQKFLMVSFANGIKGYQSQRFKENIYQFLPAMPAYYFGNLFIVQI